MNSKVMNKYFKNSQNKPEPVTEGWGTAIVQAGVFLGVFSSVVGLTTFNVPLLVGGAGFSIPFIAGSHKLQKISEANVKKILSNPKMKKYIESECDKIFSELKKRYSGKNYILTNKVSEYDFEEQIADNITEKSEVSSKRVKRNPSKGMKNFVFNTVIGKYRIGLYADTDHVDGMDVFFTLTNKNVDSVPRLVFYQIPSPTREDIKAMGFRKE